MEFKRAEVFLNDLISKSFILSNVLCEDFTSFTHSLTECVRKKKLGKKLKNVEDLITVSFCSVLNGMGNKSELMELDDEDEDDEDAELKHKILLQQLGTPNFVFTLIQVKDLINKIIILKDYEKSFKDRKESTALYHMLEENYFELQKRKIKLVILSNKNLNMDTETAFKKYTFNNQEILADLLKDQKLIKVKEPEKVAKNLTGINLQEAMNLLKERKDLPVEALNLKRRRITEKNPEIEVIKPNKNMKFDKVIGLDNFKSFTQKIMEKKIGKAALLLGLPGTGKSLSAKCLGSELGLDTLKVTIGSMQSKYVGESESNTSRILKALDDYGPAIIFFDELDKGLAGVGSQGGDSGTSKRQGGQILSWMNDREMVDGYVIATANDISHLPPEFTRAGRFDAIWVVDRPNKTQLYKMIEFFLKKYKVENKLNKEQTMELIETMHKQKTVGSEVEAVVKNMFVMDVDLIEANEMTNKMGKELSKEEKKKYRKA